MTFVGQTLSDKIAAARRRSPGLCRTRKVKVEMVTYFDKDFCSRSGCMYYDQEDLLCCSRNFKDLADCMTADCEPPKIQKEGFHAWLEQLIV